MVGDQLDICLSVTLWPMGLANVTHQHNVEEEQMDYILFVLGTGTTVLSTSGLHKLRKS